jgi:hypothetical protein
MTGDYSQSGDPYRIEQVYSSQSAASVASSPLRWTTGECDVRGNTATGPRGIPTQAEADAVKGTL